MFSGAKSTEEELAKFKPLHWKRKIANPISKIDDFVKHVFREHNQEAEHWAHVECEGKRKIVIDTRDNSESWKAVKGFLDGSSEDNGKSGCGVVVKGVGQMGNDQ